MFWIHKGNSPGNEKGEIMMPFDISLWNEMAKMLQIIAKKRHKKTFLIIYLREFFFIMTQNGDECLCT